MRVIILFLILTSTAYSNQGVNIACVNMKNLLDKEFKVDKFYYDEFKLQYFDEDSNTYLDIPEKYVFVNNNSFGAEFPKYKINFDINEFEDGRNPIMTMTKHDLVNQKIIGDYLCDAKIISSNG
jgi:hypothetical protein